MRMIIIPMPWTSLVVHCLRLLSSTAGGVGSIPDPGTKIPCAAQHSQKKKTKTTMPAWSKWHLKYRLNVYVGFWGGSVVKNPPTNTGDTGSIPGSGRFSGEGNGNPFQYSCLGNPMDRGAWGATVHGITKSRTWLSTIHKWKDTYNWIRKVNNQNRSDCTLYRKESGIAYGGKEYLKAHVEIETHKFRMR